MERLQKLTDRLDAILTISSAAIGNPNYEPSLRDFEFLIDSTLEVLNQMKGVIHA
jgi:hypothetical protein